MNPFKELNSKYRTLEEGLGSLVMIAREAEQGEIAERAEVTLAKAKERVFRVAIAGEFSTGKSTVINALLVDTGPIVTGGGVTLAIDTTLHLLARSIGQEMAEETARLMEYDQAWRVNRETRKTVAVDHGVG